MKFFVKHVSPVSSYFILLTLKWSLQHFIPIRRPSVILHKFHIYTKWQFKILSRDRVTIDEVWIGS
jgi:hypothetical protein